MSTSYIMGLRQKHCTTIYTDNQRQLLWLYAEDKGVKWVKGFEVIGANTVNKDYYERLLKEKNENDTVLDNTFGSCTTGIACINTNRNFIGIENNMDYFNISLKRVEEKRKEKEFNLITSFGDGM